MKKNRLLNLKRNSNEKIKLGELIQDEIRGSESNFNYDSLKLKTEDEDLLKEYEKSLIFQGQRLGETAYKIGEILEKAKKLFEKYTTDEDPINFKIWYESIGLNKDQVYLFRGRFKLITKKPEYKDNILKLSDATVKETINKKTSEDILVKVLKGELKTANEVKEERKKDKSRALDLKTEDNNIEIIVLDEGVELVEKKEQNDVLRIEQKLFKIKEKLNGLSNEQLKKIEEILSMLDFL